MWILMAFHIVLQSIGVFVYYISFIQGRHFNVGIRYADILTLYRILGMTEFILVAVLVPVVTSGAISGERERKTFDLLLTTPLTPAQIVFGKLMSSLYAVLILMLSSLPIFGLVFSVGGILLRDLLAMYFYLFLQAVLFGSICICASVYCKRTMTASLTAYLTAGGLLFGTLLITICCYLFLGQEAGYHTLEDVLHGWMTEEAKANDWNLLLLGNPLCSFLHLLKEQTGTMELALMEYGSPAGLAGTLREHWSLVGMGIQCLASLVLLTLSVCRLSKGPNS